MAFQSSNPTLTQKMFDRTMDGSIEERMTVRGSLQKFGFLLFMVVGGAAYTWSLFEKGQIALMTTLMWVGIIGGLISVLIIAFKPKTAPYLAPAYGILEGFFLGAISVIINNAVKESYPGIVMQAVGLTFGVAIAMYLLYSFKIIKATERFKSILFTATAGIAIFYLLTMVLRMFGVNMPFMYDSSLLGIGPFFICNRHCCVKPYHRF